MYGGLQAGLGLLRSDVRRPALVALAGACDGLATARLGGVVLDGVLTAYTAAGLPSSSARRPSRWDSSGATGSRHSDRNSHALCQKPSCGLLRGVAGMCGVGRRRRPGPSSPSRRMSRESTRPLYLVRPPRLPDGRSVRPRSGTRSSSGISPTNSGRLPRGHAGRLCGASLRRRRRAGRPRSFPTARGCLALLSYCLRSSPALGLTARELSAGRARQQG